MTFLGGATGLYCGYLDFIAWDLPSVLTAAQAFFKGSDLPYAHFHAFRRDVGCVPLLDEKEPEPDIHEDTGSLLSAEDIAALESFDEGVSGYFGKMEDSAKNRLARICRLPSGTPTPVTIWMTISIITRR